MTIDTKEKSLATLNELLTCFRSWKPEVRVLGNVRADDAEAAIIAAIYSVAATEACWCKSTGKDCHACELLASSGATQAAPTPGAIDLPTVLRDVRAMLTEAGLKDPATTRAVLHINGALSGVPVIQSVPDDNEIMAQYEQIVTYPENLTSGDYASAIKLVKHFVGRTAAPTPAPTEPFTFDTFMDHCDRTGLAIRVSDLSVSEQDERALPPLPGIVGEMADADPHRVASVSYGDLAAMLENYARAALKGTPAAQTEDVAQLKRAYDIVVNTCRDLGAALYEVRGKVDAETAKAIEFAMATAGVCTPAAQDSGVQAEPVAKVVEGPSVGMGIPTRDIEFIGSRAKVGDKLYLAASPAPSAAPMTYDEFMAEGKRRGFKLVGAAPSQVAQTSEPVDLLPPLGIRNDRDMLNYLMVAFDNEIGTCERCGHSEPTKNMDSASFLRDYLRAAPVAPSQTVPDSEILSALLWIYRRLPTAFGRLPSVEKAIKALATRTHTDVTEDLAERASNVEQACARAALAHQASAQSEGESK